MHPFFFSFLIEFGPVALFLTVYYFTDFFTAVEVAVCAVVLAVVCAHVWGRRIAWFPIVTLASTLAFGGASLLFKNETYYILQDTVGSFVFAGVFLYSVWRGTPILKSWFQYMFALTERGWRVLTIRWAIFFLITGSLNEVVRLTQTPELWVWFKLSITIATVLFGAYQFRLSVRERVPMESDRLGFRIVPSSIVGQDKPLTASGITQE